MIDEPVPRMPLTMPARSPTARTKTNSNPRPHPEVRANGVRARRGPMINSASLEGWPRAQSACPRPSRRVLRTLLRVSAILVPQLESLNLSRRGFRQAVDDLDPARIFPHADLLLHMFFQRV